MSKVRARLILREAVATSLSQTVTSAFTVLVVTGLCLTVMLTAGRTVGSTERALASLDSASARSLVVNADASAGLSSSVVSQLGEISGISWAGAFGPAVDLTNLRNPGSQPVPLREVWTESTDELGLPPGGLPAGAAVASRAALQDLGAIDGVALAGSDDGGAYAIRSGLTTPEFLMGLEPLVLRPRPASQPNVVTVLVVVARSAAELDAVRQVVVSLLVVEDASKISVSTSSDIAGIQALLSEQLGSDGRNLTLSVLSVGLASLAGLLYASVLVRRRDYGRRRALGATRAFIIQLILLQTIMLAAAGATVGCGLAAAGLLVLGEPTPAPSYFLAVGILSTASAAAAAVAPAASAARRDPVRELRVP